MGKSIKGNEKHGLKVYAQSQAFTKEKEGLGRLLVDEDGTLLEMHEKKKYTDMIKTFGAEEGLVNMALYRMREEVVDGLIRHYGKFVEAKREVDTSLDLLEPYTGVKREGKEEYYEAAKKLREEGISFGALDIGKYGYFVDTGSNKDLYDVYQKEIRVSAVLRRLLNVRKNIIASPELEAKVEEEERLIEKGLMKAEDRRYKISPDSVVIYSDAKYSANIVSSVVVGTFGDHVNAYEALVWDVRDEEVIVAGMEELQAGVIMGGKQEVISSNIHENPKGKIGDVTIFDTKKFSGYTFKEIEKEASRQHPRDIEGKKAELVKNYYHRPGFVGEYDGGDVETKDEGRRVKDVNSKSYELSLSADDVVAGAMSYRDGGDLLYLDTAFWHVIEMVRSVYESNSEAIIILAVLAVLVAGKKIWPRIEKELDDRRTFNRFEEATAQDLSVDSSLILRIRELIAEYDEESIIEYLADIALENEDEAKKVWMIVRDSRELKENFVSEANDAYISLLWIIGFAGEDLSRENLPEDFTRRLEEAKEEIRILELFDYTSIYEKIDENDQDGLEELESQIVNKLSDEQKQFIKGLYVTDEGVLVGRYGAVDLTDDESPFMLVGDDFEWDVTDDEIVWQWNGREGEWNSDYFDGGDRTQIVDTEIVNFNADAVKDYLVIITVYNEQAIMRKTINTIEKIGYLEKCLFVDDGSWDETPDILRDMAKEKGINVFIGTQNRRKIGQIKVTMDALEALHVMPEKVILMDGDSYISSDTSLSVKESIKNAFLFIDSKGWKGAGLLDAPYLKKEST
ncbi:MAG: glycosyltransferase, partial [Candidatus Omnitrophica bacterium]|nr:glycosyltransferase [Candidatus Omnitrophota bacterium]